MPFRDSTNQEIALEVLKRLGAMGLQELRPMEKRAPVGRNTLAAWKKGDYGMKGPTRAKCLAWLGEPAPEARPLTATEERAVAAKWMRWAAEHLEECVTRLEADGPPPTDAGVVLAAAGKTKLAREATRRRKQGKSA